MHAHLSGCTGSACALVVFHSARPRAPPRDRVHGFLHFLKEATALEMVELFTLFDYLSAHLSFFCGKQATLCPKQS